MLMILLKINGYGISLPNHSSPFLRTKTDFVVMGTVSLKILDIPEKNLQWILILVKVQG